MTRKFTKFPNDADDPAWGDWRMYLLAVILLLAFVFYGLPWLLSLVAP